MISRFHVVIFFVQFEILTVHVYLGSLYMFTNILVLFRICSGHFKIVCNCTRSDFSQMKFSAQDLKRDPTELFDLVEKIGVGSYGTVYRAIHKRTGQQCAVKQIPLDYSSLNETIQEINTMTEFESEYLVKFYASFKTSELLWIVMEFCEAGSVSDVMNLCETCLTEEIIRSICYDVLKGLSYIHSMSKIHRDIKAA